jgi:hypothetical protein
MNINVYNCERDPMHVNIGEGDKDSKKCYGVIAV